MMRRAGLVPSLPHDNLSTYDFFIELATSRVGPVLVASTLSHYEREWVLRKPGSEATGLDELPESLM